MTCFRFQFRNFRGLGLVGATLIAVFAASSIPAQEFVITKGKLSNRDFYRLVACAAPPGGECQKPILKWSERKRANLTIRITRIEAGFPAGLASKAQAALVNAINEINGVGAGIRLVPVTSGDPDIDVVFTTGSASDEDETKGTVNEYVVITGAIASARVYSSRGSSVINEATVTISDKVPASMMKSTVLEEAIQSLGLLTDIHNRYYHTRSIFSETGGGRVTKLRGQDAATLLYHYPPK